MNSQSNLQQRISLIFLAKNGLSAVVYGQDKTAMHWALLKNYLGIEEISGTDFQAVARRQGFVVVIGHPHEATLQALNEWLPTVQGKGLALAPATAVLRKRNGWE